MSSDLIETLEVENRMLRARIDRMIRETADRQANAPTMIALQVVDDPAMLKATPPMESALAPATGIEAKVCADIAARQLLGISKYGVTVQENPLPLRKWLQHAYEECLDQAVYLRRAMQEIDKGQA